MSESPRTRRLRSDQRVLETLKRESAILDFVGHGSPPEFYTVRFFGTGLFRDEASGKIVPRDTHEVTIGLGANYPRMMPELRWKTPIFHPNISAGGVVCLGGYGTNWVPSLTLDELCTMLWDMVRYANYDTESPYNRDAALWTREQRDFRFPVDQRPLRDLTASGRRDLGESRPIGSPAEPTAPPLATKWKEPEDEIVFLEPVNLSRADAPTSGSSSAESEILFLE